MLAVKPEMMQNLPGLEFCLKLSSFSLKDLVQFLPFLQQIQLGQFVVNLDNLWLCISSMQNSVISDGFDMKPDEEFAQS